MPDVPRQTGAPAAGRGTSLRVVPYAPRTEWPAAHVLESPHRRLFGGQSDCAGDGEAGALNAWLAANPGAIAFPSLEIGEAGSL